MNRAMSNYYPIFEVEPKSAFDPDRIESMGSKEKFWFRFPEEEDSGPDWLFKFPRPNTGEHWAEKIAAEVAAALGISHAIVELAVSHNVRGSISRSFLRSNEWLIHGNECLSDLAWSYSFLDWRVRPYDSRKRYGQSQHTLDTIFEAMEDYRWDKSGFAEYIILDGIIGNTDRHHENWGWVMDSKDPEWLQLAPSFDHASSLGRELSDERRERLLIQGQAGSYSERAPGAIYWSEEGRQGPAPLQLVRLAVNEYPEVFLPCLSKLSNLTEENILDIVNRIPEDWMTDLQRKFAVELMKYNLAQLRELSNG